MARKAKDVVALAGDPGDEYIGNVSKTEFNRLMREAAGLKGRKDEASTAFMTPFKRLSDAGMSTGPAKLAFKLLNMDPENRDAFLATFYRLAEWQGWYRTNYHDLVDRAEMSAEADALDAAYEADLGVGDEGDFGADVDTAEDAFADGAPPGEPTEDEEIEAPTWDDPMAQADDDALIGGGHAFNAGKAAAEDGEDRDTNPYDDDVSRTLWFRGYDAGRGAEFDAAEDGEDAPEPERRNGRRAAAARRDDDDFTTRQV